MIKVGRIFFTIAITRGINICQKRKFFTILTAVTLVLGIFTITSAKIIDFTDEHWDDAYDKKVFTYIYNNLGNLRIKIEAYAPNGARLWQDEVDGFGIKYRYENDEIEKDEELHITFHTDVILNTIYIADLFIEGYIETGEYSFDKGNSWIEFEAVNRGNNGELAIEIDGAITTNAVWFRGTGKPGHEFAVQKLDIQPIIFFDML